MLLAKKFLTFVLQKGKSIEETAIEKNPKYQFLAAFDL